MSNQPLVNIDSSPNTNDDLEVMEAPSIGSYIIMYFFSILLFPLTLLGSWLVVEPNEERVILLFGKYRTTIGPGVHFISMFGRSAIPVSKRIYSIRHHHVNVADVTGSMLEVSAVLTYQIKDTVTALLKIDDVHTYISNTSLGRLKSVISRYPYESSNPDDPSLRDDCSRISDEMRHKLKERASLAGVRVLSFELVDLQYDASIAKSMLVKQTSGALLGARSLIVHGACSIVSNTVAALKANGINLNDKERSKVVSNLLSVICSDSQGQGQSEGQRQERPDYSEILFKIDEATQVLSKLPQSIVAAQRGARY
ncbi:hypothetical protein P9112_012434 [Eukaryota sp. TZLM1-RC]